MSELANTELRLYQKEVVLAVLDSIAEKKGLTLTVEIARQGGKNEISSQIELLLLTFNIIGSGNMIKCSPTFKPQTVVSMMRLKEKLNAAGYGRYWTPEMGYIIRLADTRVIFLSAENNSNVVGNTAHLLLEVDEAQDVNEDKYTKEFKPMGSTTNVTTVLYGTTWDDSTLLEKVKQINLERERKDGLRRHFRYDWQEIAKYNPDYLAYVEAERERLGENHPLFLTQYRLLPIYGGGGFLDHIQRAQLQGTHCRTGKPEPGKIYVAGIDLAGEAETEENDFLKSLKPRRDSTVVTIGELEILPILPMPNTTNKEMGYKIPLNLPLPKGETGSGTLPKEETSPLNFLKRGTQPTIKIVEHYAWTGVKHPEIYPKIIDLIKITWHCRKVIVDATGIGEPVASFLHNALGSRIVPFKFTAQSKTELGFNLLAAINSGGLKMYTADNSPEYQEFWHQMERAKSYYRPSQTMNFYVDPSEGHDDFLMSLALLVEAGRQYEPREAKGK